ncbi:MAG: hypothetical protein JKY55_20120 [Aliivibrio sp.]|uniref:hypothetical protein n=1 Tax=Aliivibrio sp. TaxID=1872443 RepID=UPI001A4BBD8E|nr:hypothetical protein [Aliivibrio sp.]
MKISYSKNDAGGLTATIDSGPYEETVNLLTSEAVRIDQVFADHSKDEALGLMVSALCYLLDRTAKENPKMHTEGSYNTFNCVAHWQGFIKSLWSAEDGQTPQVGQRGSFTIDCKGYQIRVDYKPRFTALVGGLPVDHFEFRHSRDGEPMPISETGYRSEFVYRDKLENMTVREYAESYAAENATVDMNKYNQLSLF